MTKTLQKRFVFTAMAAVSILLVILLSAVNIANIIIVNQRADRVMSILTAGRGSYDPKLDRHSENPERQFSVFRRPTPDDMMGARYFYVRFDSAGTIRHTDLKHIYAVTDEQARQIAGELYGGDPSGQYEHFQYQTIPLPEDKGQLMLFLDTSTQQESIVTVLLISLGVGLLCWLTMLLLVALMSRRAIAPIAENMERQKQFVTNAGHEIKTPLAIILANTDAMELHNGENKWSRNIRAQSERLNDLMKNLLALARTDEDGVILPMSDFSLSLLIEEALDLHSDLAHSRQLNIQTQLPPSLTMRGNRDSIMQLVSVLLDNACKYTPEGGHISVTLHKDSGKIHLQVRNTCPQAPEADLERLFDRFYRGDTARTQSSGGYGIGLSAARAIAQSHGGTITASYDKAEQTITFTVIL